MPMTAGISEALTDTPVAPTDRAETMRESARARTLPDVRRVALALAAAVSLTTSGVRAAEVDGSAPATFGSVHPEIAGRFMTNAFTLTPADRAPPLVGGGAGVRAGVSVLGNYAGVSFIDSW